MRSRALCHPSFAVLLLAALCPFPAAAQVLLAPPPPPPIPGVRSLKPQPRPLAKGPYRVAGHLVDAADGHPLAHASIVLYDLDTESRIADVQTDATGEFAVASLPAGKFRLEGAARGYITASYDEHEEYSSAIVTGAGLDTESLVLKLQPAARMNGRVTDEAGDPVRNAAVSLFRESTESGTHRITLFRNARTDDLGRYELPTLPSGTYYATVRAVPWYATHPPSDEAEQNNLGVAAHVDPALDVTYPLMFYPEATDSSGASPIKLKPADLFTADFRLTPQPALQLLFRMSDPGSPPRPSFPQLQQKVFDSMEQVVEQNVRMQGTTAVIAGLSAGQYVVRLNGQNGPGPAHTVDLNGGSATVDAASLPSFGAVTLKLAESGAAQAKDRGKPMKDLQFMLHRTGEGEADPMTPVPWSPMKDGTAEIRNVEPGDYRVQPAGDRYHVESITENGKTRPGALLHVTGDGQTATITLGTGTVEMTGFAKHEGKGESGVMVVLVPAGGDHSVDLYRRDQSDLDGSFSFSTVVPGNYLLVAIRDGWGLEWGKPEAIAQYLSKAVPVTVPNGGQGAMKISEAVLVQPR